MTALLLASALGAAATLTWLHLRPRGTRAAPAVPSLQHLRGSPPRRRRTLHLEEAWAWALRAACLLLALSGVWASRAGCAADARPVALLDAAAPASAWQDVLRRTQAVAALGFQGEQPRTAGDVPGPMQAALRECSNSRAACLLRAAALSARPAVLVGPLDSLEWRLALGQWARPFAFLRTPGTAAPPVADAEAPLPPRAHVQLAGTSAAAQGWAAALAVAAGPEVATSAGSPNSPLVEVTQPGQAIGPAPGAALQVVAVDGPGGAQPGAPAVEARTGQGLVLPDPLDVAAGTAGLGLPTTLALAQDSRFTEVLPMAALHNGPGPRQLVLAASAEELGNWAHQGSLVPLARALLAAGLPGPAPTLAPPAGGPLGWRDAAGQRAPVGLLDVQPGEYLREDGRVALHLKRVQVPGPAALDDAQLSRLGGHRLAASAPGRPAWPPLLFALALGCWAWAVWQTRAARAAWLPAAGVAAGLGLLWADASYEATRLAPFEAALALPAGADASTLGRLANQTGVGLEAATEAGLGCARAGAQRPCTLLGTVGLAEAPAEGTNILLFDETRPRVDVLQVEAPQEVALGQAAEVWVTVRARRARGRSVTLTVHSSSAAPASQEVAVDAEDVVRTVRLSLAPLTAGLSFVAVQAAVAGEAQAQDGRLLTLATRARTTRRLVLAAAPGWEARAAAEALETPGADVQVLSLLGARAVLSRGRAPQSPLGLLTTAEGLQGVELLVLVGFGPGPLDEAAGAALRQYVHSGGAALVLDAPAAAAALGVELAPVPATAPLQLLQGQLGEEVVGFRGYAPTATLREPPLATVLGRLGPASQAALRPWVVGRALGQGRLAVVTAPDAWRLSPPGQDASAYRTVLARLVGWLLAPRASRAGVVLAEDWASVRLGAHTWPLPLTGPVDGLAVDAVELETLLPWPRARLRAAAAARRHPFLEVDGAEALTAAWRRLPEAPRWKGRVALRDSDGAFAAVAALLALEAVARRLYGGGSAGSRATRAPSSRDAGGTTSGEGRSQRDSATPAARAAAPREAASPPA